MIDPQPVIAIKNQIFKKPLKKPEVIIHANILILIIRPHQRVPEIPRLLRKNIIIHLIPHRTKILYHENRYRTSIPDMKWMNKP